MDDKRNETSLASILNELRKTNAEDMSIADSECFSIRSDFDFVKFEATDLPNSSVDGNTPNIFYERASSNEIPAPDNTFATTTVQNLDNNVQMFEKAAGISDSLFYNELPKEPAVNESFSSRNVKKRNESNRGQVFKKILKSPQPTGIKKPKLVDDNSTVLENSTQHLNKSVKCAYNLGEIVWAKITGYSHWPAMIDEDPDIRWHFWPTDTFLPTHYHVVFFDTNNRLSRSWVKSANIKLFTEVVRVRNSRPKEYIDRFKKSVNEAKLATKMNLKDRLKKYSFRERVNLPGIKLCQD